MRKRQNLFEIDNARNLTRDELVATFVPTKSFWRLLSTTHHVVLGSRGSGKTALAKMLSHDHLSKLTDKKARAIIDERAFIGIYVPTELEWVSGLKNKPWQTEREKEEFFQWRLNLSTCMSLLVTLRSCLETYILDNGERAVIESSLATEIGRAWFEPTSEFETLRQLERLLQKTEHDKQLQLARMRAMGHPAGEEPAIGVAFAIDLFVPLRRGIRLSHDILNLPDHTSWLLCIDETEFLEELHHTILNSHLRAYSKGLSFKITTMPYHHYTLSTNTGVPLDVGHDFEYAYIDQDPVIWAGGNDNEGRTFADNIFTRRAVASGTKYEGLTLRTLLGRSKLLEPKAAEWGPDSHNMALLRKYAKSSTTVRAERLANSPKSFMDQIGRKIVPALLIREATSNIEGRKEIDLYSGEMMAIRCGDANPRRLIRIFNRLLLEISWTNTRRRYQSTPLISSKQQTRMLKAFGASTLNPVQSEENVGPELFSLLDLIGLYMHKMLHEVPLSTDQFSSVSVDVGISEHGMLIRRAVALGLLFPHQTSKYWNQMPEGEGKFRLAYVLAPLFDIIPRKGKAVSLATVLNEMDGPRKVRDNAQWSLAFGKSESGRK